MSKISISLPTDVLRRAEQECRQPGESRSQLFRRALQGLIDRHREEARVSSYLAGYIAEPETDDEQLRSQEGSLEAVAESPWE